MPPRVHFARTNTFYSPPLTPSPTYSSASLPSSSGPDTPPPHLKQQRSSPFPFATQDLSCELDLSELSISPTPTFIHPVLGLFNPPLIDYDLSRPPMALTTHNKIDLPPSILASPATDPPLTSLLLTCPILPWSITVTPADPTPSAPVTVLDIFTTLHRVLRLPVTPLEFSSIPTPAFETMVVEAYQTRYRRFHADKKAYELEKSKGVKRIDFLAGCVKFVGLASSDKPDVWILHLCR